MSYEAMFGNRIKFENTASGQSADKASAAPETSVRDDVAVPTEDAAPVGTDAGQEPVPEIGQELELAPEPADTPESPAGVQPADVPPAEPAQGPDASAGLAAGIRSKDADKDSHCWVPRNIVNMVRQQIPGAANRNDALTAYLYVTLNREPVVSDEIRTLAETYTGDSEVAAMRSQIGALSKSLAATSKALRGMETTLDRMTTMLVWLVGERIGASIDLTQPAASMDFLFQEHEFIRRQAANQTDEYGAYLSELEARARYKAAAAARDSRRPK